MTRKDIIDTERKTPAENARDFLVSLCVGFTVIMTICMVLGSIFADERARQGINYCWSLLGACACSAMMQFVFFTPVIIKRLSYTMRLVAFGLCLYALLAVLAMGFGWFPANQAGAWVSFTVTYLFTLAVATAAYAGKHRREERELNDRLAEYHRANG